MTSTSGHVTEVRFTESKNKLVDTKKKANNIARSLIIFVG